MPIATEYICTECGNQIRRVLNVFAETKCPSCGAKGTLKEPKAWEAEEKHEVERLALLTRLGVEPADWKVVGVATPLIGESQNAKKVQTILNDQANEGWEFVFFGESARLVDGPVLIFRRKRPSPTETSNE
jgi:DNA-directed RNA polymerase subunit RPC12/RpoP